MSNTGLVLAAALEDYLAGMKNSYELEDLLDDLCDSSEVLIREMAKAVSCIFDSGRCHFNLGQFRVTPEIEQMVRRWITTLRSNYSEVIIGESGLGIRTILFRHPFCQNHYWPFRGKDEWHHFVSRQRQKGFSIES